MSLPTYSLTCSKCSLDRFFMPYGTAFRYRLPDGSDIGANVREGWCSQCDAPQKIQPAITPDYLREQNQQLQHQLAQRPKLGIFGSLFSKFLSAGEKLNLDLMRGNLEWIAKFQQLVGNRVINARCLVCGSTSVTEFALPEYGYESRIPLPLSHPNCGGQLMIAETGRFPVHPKPPIFIAL